MATKTKAKKAKRKPGAKGIKKNLTPKLECPTIVDMRTPHTTESSGKLAAACTSITDAKNEWTAEVRKHFAAGGKQSDLPQFDSKNFVDPNKTVITRKQYDKMTDQWNDGDPVVFPPRYNPVLVELCHAMNADTLRRRVGERFQTQPRNWDEKAWGLWHLLDVEGEHTVASGWVFDTDLPRRCHAETAEKLLDDTSHILTFGNNRYVVGDGTAVRCAPMLVWATTRGNYRAGDAARKRMSIAGNKDIVDAVFKIEDKANNGGGFTVKANWGDIQEMVFMPGQVLTAGFLYGSNGKRLDAKAIRALDGDTKGLKFKTVSAVLGGPIVAKAIDWDKLWPEIQTIEGNKGIKKMREREGRSESDETDKSPQNKSRTNIKTTTRISPNEAFPFGARAAQCDMVPYTVYEADGEFSMGVVIGDRSNLDYNVGVNEAKAAAAETEVVEEAPASKKAAKKKAAKPADAAPPIESDTADDVETVEA